MVKWQFSTPTRHSSTKQIMSNSGFLLRCKATFGAALLNSPAGPVPPCGASPNAGILRLARQGWAGGAIRFGCGERPEAAGADLASGWFER
jgi:hypothetical protein